jgi:hypothetical protein
MGLASVLAVSALVLVALALLAWPAGHGDGTHRPNTGELLGKDPSRNAAEAAAGTSQIAQNITGVNDSRTTAAELTRVSSELQQLVGRFTY